MEGRESAVAENLINELKEAHSGGFVYTPTDMTGEKQLRKIGLELEFIMVKSSGASMGHTAELSDTLSVLRRITEKDGTWDAVEKGMRLKKDVGVQERGGKKRYELSIGTDLGSGLLEVNFLPFERLSGAEDHFREMMALVSHAAEENNMLILGYGVQPMSKRSTDYMMPKARYGLLLERYGENLLNFTLPAANQVHFEVSIGESIHALNMLNRASPAIIAMTANASIMHGERTKYLDIRNMFWKWLVNGRKEDWERVGIAPDFADHDNYFSRLLEFQPFMTKREEYMSVSGYRSLAEFIKAEDASAIRIGSRERVGIVPSITDVYFQEGTVWWDARLKSSYGTIELRCPSLQPSTKEILAVAALGLGLIENLGEASKRLSLYSENGLKRARHDAIRMGLGAKIVCGNDREDIAVLAKDLLSISWKGLRRRGLVEEKYLDPLYSRISEMRVPAQKSECVLNEKGFQEFVESARLRI